jgi:hypothetical protein
MHLTIEQSVVGFDDLIPATIIMQDGSLLLETVSSGLGYEWRQTRTEVATPAEGSHQFLIVVDHHSSLLPFDPEYVLTLNAESLDMLSGEPLAYHSTQQSDQALYAVRQWSSFGFSGEAGRLARFRVAAEASVLASSAEIEPNTPIAEAIAGGLVLAPDDVMAGEIEAASEEDYVAISIPEAGACGTRFLCGAWRSAAREMNCSLFRWGAQRQ